MIFAIEQDLSLWLGGHLGVELVGFLALDCSRNLFGTIEGGEVRL